MPMKNMYLSLKSMFTYIIGLNLREHTNWWIKHLLDA